MPFNDPTPTVQDLIVNAVRQSNDAIKSVARAAAELVEPFRVNIYPQVASDLLPELGELVTGWFGVAERILGDEKDLLLALADLVQPQANGSEARPRKTSSAKAAQVAA